MGLVSRVKLLRSAALSFRLHALLTLVWAGSLARFRKLFLVLSRYTYINTWHRVT